MAEIEKVLISFIETGERGRSLNESRVPPLMESIQAIGLQTPISVWLEEEDGGDQHVHLVAGLHRLEAAKRLGWEKIDAIYVEMDEIDRQLWEIDENLCRSELTEAEEAQHLARRKELWEARETANSFRSFEGRGNKGFASETASVSGQTARSVQKKIARAQKIEPKLLEEVKGTELDKGVVLDELAAAPKQDQRAKLAEIALRRQEAERTRKDVEAANRSTDRVIGLSEAQQFADWLMRRTDINELPTIIAWLEGTKPKDVIAAMRRMAA